MIFPFFRLTLLSSLIFASAAQAATFTLEIQDGLRFLPNQLTVTQGDTVVFVNHSKGVHTVTADPALAADPTHIILPHPSEAFHSGRLAPGATFTRVFTVAGNYQYVCLPHEKMGMMGQITVQAGASQ